MAGGVYAVDGSYPWFIAVNNLPNGHEKATWGMTAEELQRIASVERADTEEGFNYAEHQEEDPEVYIRLAGRHERIEYYFFQGKLYKIFIVYDRILYHTPFYKRLIDEVKADFGPPHGTYQEEFFGLPIQHNLWEDNVSSLDIRKGAGFVYQVRTHKNMAEKKARLQQRKKSI
jgi:hypothetical protein